MILSLLKLGVQMGASDIHLASQTLPMARINAELVPLSSNATPDTEIERFIKNLLDDEQLKTFFHNGDFDASYHEPGIGSFRINIYRSSGKIALACRFIHQVIPTIESLCLPPVVNALASYTSGLILVTGPTSSGKTRTLAAMIDYINSQRSFHIITLEDPIEYIHQNKKSLISQREIGRDTISFQSALRAALRQDPNVIMVGEMRDLETISTAITAAETGHLVLATLHTGDAVQTLARIIDVFPPNQQQQIQVQLSHSIVGIISQRLLPRKDKKGLIPAVEIMHSTPAIKNMIREGKFHQIYTAMQTGKIHGMQTMESSLQKLIQDNLIDGD
ncbi:MAG: PilT/PilU family type 4a pilus ATPase [Syntrophomonadaceae bacterium]|nr:PilT/PilU family type 4a pilus ATPase [Syntrophomonadaceae bacterium]